MALNRQYHDLSPNSQAVYYYMAINTDNWYLKGQCLDWLSIVLAPDFHIILPNAKKYTNKLDKKILQNEREQVFGMRSTQDYKDGSV